MNRLVLSLALAATVLSGCAQLKHTEPQPSAGGSALEEQRPYPTHFRNDHYYAP